MPILEFIKSMSGNKKTSGVNCQEAYNIWEVLAGNYEFRHSLNIWKNYAHDKDLLFIIHSTLKTVNTHIEELEQVSQRHSINGPDADVADVNTSVNTEVLRDEFIAMDLFLRLQERTDMTLRAARTSTTNEELRKLFMRHTNSQAKSVDAIITYLRLKGWLRQPPLYQNVPPDEKESLDAGEAFHLWDHLTYRYDNVHQTEIYIRLAHDPEFKLLLTHGVHNVLSKEVDRLEKECLRFGIPLPKRPPTVVTNYGVSTEFVTDDYLLRMLLSGVTGATLLHACAVKQCVTNSRIRNLFRELLQSEITIQDNLIKYGKLKGYLNEPPEYRLLE